MIFPALACTKLAITVPSVDLLRASQLAIFSGRRCVAYEIVSVIGRNRDGSVFKETRSDISKACRALVDTNRPCLRAGDAEGKHAEEEANSPTKSLWLPMKLGSRQGHPRTCLG